MSRLVLDPAFICNMALRHLAQSSGIMNLANDRSAAGEACRLFYPTVLDEVLRDFPFSFTATFASLALVTGPVPAALYAEYAYAYRVPVDCLKVRRVLNGFSRIETQSTRVPYRVVHDSGGMLIFCDYAPIAATATTPALPMIEYTQEASDASLYPADFGQAMALLLAVYIAPTVTAGDKFKLGARAQQLYEWARLRAQASSANENQPDQLPGSEYEQARDGLLQWPSYAGGWRAYPSAPPDL